MLPLAEYRTRVQRLALSSRSFPGPSRPSGMRLRSAPEVKDHLIKNLRHRVKTLSIVALAVVLLTVGGVAQAGGHAAPVQTHGKAKGARAANVQPCTGQPSGTLAAPLLASARHHSVTLSWNASIPRSKARRDAIKGYYVYRSLTSHKYSESNRLNSSPLRGTRCVDTAVEPRGTYSYAVKAVSEGGTPSGLSNEITVVIPFP